jgi:HAE1 family hydrophobic/amphiphilic exporter-1
MYRFFINRPIVAMVISIVLVITGAVTVATLPTALFPDINPPEILIRATYPGANAQAVEESVAIPIEEQMSGVDNMNYMYSINSNDGLMSMIVDFDVKTNPDTDQILTKVRESQAEPQLPVDVRNLGVTVQKSLFTPLMLVSLYSPDDSRDEVFLANYAYINIIDELLRLPGIGNVQVFGAGQYSMRLWVKPDLLAQKGIIVPDIINAIQEQNAINPAGQIGGPPTPEGQEYTYAVHAQGRLTTPEQFGDIVLRETNEGGVVRVKDVARVELGAQLYNVVGRFNGRPAAIIAVYQLPGSNAIDAVDGVRKKIDQLKQRFPQGMDYVVSLDTTQAVREGIREIIKTLLIALCLVILVVYLFLQNWRATLIPLLAVPVSLVGTFIVFPALGFSINTLSLFGLVLAIGLVVDDAIVVVEAVQRHIELGESPKDATFNAMKEISGPVIGMALVLSTVFVPTAFIPGITGRLYQQFAVTIAVSVLISGFNALSLSPALSALLLRPAKPSRGLPGKFFSWFNRTFSRGTQRYVTVCGTLIRKSPVALLLLACFAIAAGFLGLQLPTSFLPEEDQGYFYVNLQLPQASSLVRTEAVAQEVQKIIAATPGVRYTTAAVGFSLLSTVRSTYSAFFFVTLRPWSERKKPEEQIESIQARLNEELSKIPQAIAFGFSPPSIPGVGTAGGFTFILEDRAGKDIDFLNSNLKRFLDAAQKRPELAGLATTFLPSVPQIHAYADRDKILKQGVPVGDVYRTLQVFLGGVFVNYFNRFGRQWPVYVEADGTYRSSIEGTRQFYVRNNRGDPVPLDSVMKFRPQTGPEFISHHNLFRSAQVNGHAASGYSSTQAMDALEEVFRETMPREMGYDYQGMSFQEKKAQQGVPPAAVFGFSLLFVFLILAALYESWSLPFSVLLGTPIGVFGAFAALFLRKMENDVFAQIGLVMLIGLAAKNAILIVEFARTEHERGKPPAEAALAGAKLRLRPILMTSFAFIFGCLPLWTASGAGAVARRIMGTTVVGGMVAASGIAILLIPVIFYLVEKVFRSAAKNATPTEPVEPVP